MPRTLGHRSLSGQVQPHRVLAPPVACPRPVTYPVTHPSMSLDDLLRSPGAAPLLWCRIRTGFGSMGAIPVKSPEQARSWIRYWQDMRNVPGHRVHALGVSSGP